MQLKLKNTMQKTCNNSEDSCIRKSQQYLCIAQLTFCSEAGPTADVGQQDGALRYGVNIKNISMIINGSTASFIPLTCRSQNIWWQSVLIPILVQPFSQPTGPQVSIANVVKDVFFLYVFFVVVCVFLVFHLIHSRAYHEAKQHTCRRDDGGMIRIRNCNCIQWRSCTHTWVS